MTIALSTQSLFCCGHSELGDFMTTDIKDVLGNEDHDALVPGNSYHCIRAQWQAETPEKLLNQVLKSKKALGYTIWFVRPKTFDGKISRRYEFGRLRAAVKKIKGVKHLGGGINPNSGNYIDGYFFKGTP